MRKWSEDLEMWHKTMRPADYVLWKGPEDIPFTKVRRNELVRGIEHH